MIRALLPVDMPAVIYFYTKVPVNQAKPRDSLGQRQRSLPSLVPLPIEWFPRGRRRYSLAFFHRGLIYGLVSAKSCSGLSAWEIERLMFAERPYDLTLIQRLSQGLARLKLGKLFPTLPITTPMLDLGPNLLERLSHVLGHFGVGKLFLSLPTTSPMLDLAQRAGFSPYLAQSLYRFEGSKSALSPPPYILRPKSEADEYELYRLYNTITPASVRSAEGLTFQEWRQTKEPITKGELVYEKEGCLCALLRIRTDGSFGQFEIMAELDKAQLRQLIQWSLTLLDSQWPIFCLASDFQGQLQRLLIEHGFEHVAEYSRLVKQLQAPVHKLEFMPLRA